MQYMDDLIKAADDIFDDRMLHFFVHDEERAARADDFIRQRSALGQINQPELNQAREHLSKLACMLHPDKKIYWIYWTQDLSLFDKEKRKKLVDEVDYLAEVIPATRKKAELNMRFYTDFIGRDEVGRAVSLKISQRQAQKDAELKMKPEPVVPEGQDIFDVIYNYIEKAPVMNTNERQKTGMLLSEEVKNHEDRLEPVAAATMHLSVAYIADNTIECFRTAKKFIQEKIKLPGEIAEIATTLQTMMEESKETTLFYRAAGKMLNSFNLK